MKAEKPKFYALWKNFNSGKIEVVDVLEHLFNDILTEKNTINKKRFKYYNDATHTYDPITTKEVFAKLVRDGLIYHFWGKCEWEYLAIDWPNRDMVEESHPVKISVYDQIEPNINIIVDLAWNYIEPKIKKIYGK